MRIFLALVALSMPVASFAAVIDPSLPHPTEHHGVVHTNTKPHVLAVRSRANGNNATSDRDPGLVCRSVIARALSDWGTDTGHFDLQLAPVGDGKFVFRIDDTARSEPWRETVASGQCLAGLQEGHVQVQSFSIGPVDDPKLSCQSMLLGQAQQEGIPASSVDVDSDPANPQGIFMSLHGQVMDARQHVVAHGRCDLGVGADGTYALSGASVVR